MSWRDDELDDPSPVLVWLQHYGVFCLWVLVAWGMWQSWQHDPLHPTLEGADA